MRSFPVRFALLAIAFALLGGPAFAQFGWKPKVEFQNPFIGFRPAGGNDRSLGNSAFPVVKVGAWAPIYFGLKILGETRKGFVLEVSALDGDGLTTTTYFPVYPAVADGQDPMPPGSTIERTEVLGSAYVRVAGELTDVKLRIVAEDDREKSLSESIKISGSGVRSPSTYVILSLGSTPLGLGFKRPDKGKPGETPNPLPYLRDGRVELGRIDTVEEMPDQWFGYSGADLVVLGTGMPDQEFISNLFNSGNEKFGRKRRALFEWVRRGGKLIISAGGRAADVAASQDFAAILPVQIGPAVRESRLILPSFGSLGVVTELQFAERSIAPYRNSILSVTSGLAGGFLPEKLAPDSFPVAAFKPNDKKSPFTILMSEEAGKKRPLVVQAPVGLGRVTMVAFDFDRSPFTENVNRSEFWEWLVQNAGSKFSAEAVANNKPKQPAFNAGSNSNASSEDGAAMALRANVDAYSSVPVISFGWVALFILGYTLIIGPIEYILLKKVLGKLEFTWITFPIIVLSVSGAAVLTAYSVKGKDLRMNKIDVVDIDARSNPGRIYGRTWWTIFSPNIDSYSLGVEPKDNWGKSKDEKGYSPVAVVDWFGDTKSKTGGNSRGYGYALDPKGDTGTEGNGLSGVPIRVWSTKAFTADWSGVLDPANPPVVSTLQQQPNGDGVNGTITLNLPIKDVKESFAIYRGKVYKFETGLAPGLAVRFSPGGRHQLVNESPAFKTDERFFTANREDEDTTNAFGSRRGARPVVVAKSQTDPLSNTPLSLWGLLFHEYATGGREMQNSSLRSLDQSWRINETNGDEVLVLLRLERANGAAEEMMTAPDGASPSKLWIKGLPGRGERPPVQGLLQQDTYIRIYVPVKPAGAGLR